MGSNLYAQNVEELTEGTVNAWVSQDASLLSFLSLAGTGSDGVVHVAMLSSTSDILHASAV